MYDMKCFTTKIFFGLFAFIKRIANLFQDSNKMKFWGSVCSHYKNGGRTSNLFLFFMFVAI